MAAHSCTCSPGELRPTGENHTQHRMLACEHSILQMNVDPHLKRKEERRQLNKESGSGKIKAQDEWREWEHNGEVVCYLLRVD